MYEQITDIAMVNCVPTELSIRSVSERYCGARVHVPFANRYCTVSFDSTITVLKTIPKAT